MKLGGEYRVKAIAKRNWVKLSEEMGLPAETLLARCDDVASRIVQAFESAAADSDAFSLGTRFVRQLLTELEKRVRYCRSIVSKTRNAVQDNYFISCKMTIVL